MNRASQELAGLVLTTPGGAITKPLLDALDAAFASGDAAAIVLALVSLGKSGSVVGDKNGVPVAMQALESLGQVSPFHACVLMAHLQPLVEYDHDVYDAIDLWICHSASPRLARYLSTLAATEPDARRRSHIEGWIVKATRRKSE